MPTTQTRSTRSSTRSAPRRVRHRTPIDNAEGMDLSKQNMAKALASFLEDEQMTQTEAAYLLKDAPSQISLVVTGKLHGFSTERLIRMLARSGRDIDIVARKAKGKQGKVRFVET